MNHKSLLLLPAVLLSSVALADTVTPEQALDKALSFFQQPVRTRGQQAAQSLTLAHTAQADGETHFYVFNNPAGGYVIVGGDDVAQDVLAYSESGTFDYDQLPPATRWWLGQYQSQIHLSIAAERQGIATRSAGTRAEGLPEIKPLLGGIEWDQKAPFNAYILDNNQTENPLLQYATGCVATATAQVMRYWKYPEHGMFSHAYEFKGQQMETNFAESTYQWDLMQEKYQETYSGTPEENAVVKLMSDLGTALNITYNRLYAGGSATSFATVPYALRTYFGYSKNIVYLERYRMVGLPDGMWEEIVYSELAEQRPVIYFGTNPAGGGAHSFVCDGYKSGFFHINWGWSGTANDEYYLLTATETTPALAPKEEGTGGNGYGQYGGMQGIVVGVQPDPQSEGFVYLTEPMSVPTEAPCGPLHFEGKLYNPTNQDIRALVGVLLQDHHGIFVQEKDLVMNNSMIVIPAKQEATFSLDVPEDALIPGVTYECEFSIVDASNPETLDEEYEAMPSWTFYEAIIHIEGPEHVMLSLADGLASLCVPFDAQLPEGMEAYTADRIADDQVIMKQVQSIEAGKSYLLMGEPTPQPIMLQGMKTMNEGWSNEPIFKGNMASEAQYQENACYVMTYLETGEPALIRTDEVKIIPSHKVIIDGSMSDAEVLHFNFDDSATGIQQVGERSSSLRYNLMGLPQREAKGLVIEAGRVTFVK